MPTIFSEAVLLSKLFIIYLKLKNPKSNKFLLNNSIPWYDHNSYK